MKHALFITLIFIAQNLIAQKNFDEYKKGEFRLKLGLPYINHLNLNPNDIISINKAGFLGESIGLEYSYIGKRFLEFSFSFVGVADNPLPFPFDREGEYTTQYSSYFSMTHNHKKNRITYGYGFNYSINTWAEGFRSFEEAIPNTRNQITNKVLGLTVNSYYRIGKSFNIGLIYRPTFFQTDDRLQNKYEHLISIDFLWRIRLNKK